MIEMTTNNFEKICDFVCNTNEEVELSAFSNPGLRTSMQKLTDKSRELMGAIEKGERSLAKARAVEVEREADNVMRVASTTILPNTTLLTHIYQVHQQVKNFNNHHV